MKSNLDKKVENQVKEFLKLPYTFTIGKDKEHDGKEYFYVQVNELPGCTSDGKSQEEALKNIRGAMYDWIETALLNEEKVPTPEGFSGKFTVRIPPSLHRDLITKVNKEGVSINQFITTAIARAVGF